MFWDLFKVSRAGSLKSLPFLLLIAVLASATGNLNAAEKKVRPIAFNEFRSSCIDLGHYDAKSRELTVRFVGKKADKFYCYSHVPSTVWKNLLKLNRTGGVGGYLNETIVNQPDRFPFKELSITNFTIVVVKK